MTKLPQDQVNELREAFSLFDRNGDGLVTIDELKQALQAMGVAEDSETKARLSKLEGTKKKDGVSMDEFQEFMTPLLLDTTTESDLLESFRVFDSKNNGHINIKDLNMILDEGNDKLSKADVDEIIEDMK